MSIANHNDIVSVFPDLQDHAVVEIMDMRATVDDLEAALALLTSDDKDLVGIQQREGDRIHRLMNILNQAGVQSLSGRDR